MPKSPQIPELIPTIEVAALARVDVATVNRWARTGRLVAAMKVPGQTGPNLFRRTDVDRLLKSRREAA